MAVKNHDLDPVIIEQARKEFLQYGYKDASLHRIASNANITTGALYTRYKGKDDLFSSLLKDFLSIVSPNLSSTKPQYERAKSEKNGDKFMEIMTYEEKKYIDIMFNYYDDCKLFFCKSEGSSVGNLLAKIIKEKTQQTAQFLKTDRGIDYDGIKLLMTEQFNFYKSILENGYSKEKAISVLDTINIFLSEGWKKIFTLSFD